MTMQALLADLFPWVVALYLADGLVQARRGHLLLVSGGGPFRLLRAGLHLVGVSPLDEVVAAHDLPFLASTAHVHVLDPRAKADVARVEEVDLEAVPLDALHPVEREARRVRGAGQVLVVAPTAEWAEALREDLAALAAAPPNGRPALLARRHAERGDLAAARALRARQRPFLAPLRACAVLLAAAFFVLWPLAAYAPERAPIPAGALLATIGLLVLAAGALALAMALRCGEGGRAAVASALHLVLFPLAAAHPLLHAGRGLYRRFDAMVVAAVLLPADALRAVAGRELWRARLSRAFTPATLGAAWDSRERLLAALLAATGSTTDEALAAPDAVAEMAGWCPLCGAQYRAGRAACADCGVPVQPFTP